MALGDVEGWGTSHSVNSFVLFGPAGKGKQDYLPYQRRGSLQLWQFLLTLLDNPANGHLIIWTGRNMEFKLIDPEEVSGST